MTTGDIIALIIGILGFITGVAAIVNSNFKRYTSERVFERSIDSLGKI
jgi:hypothetical protein